ncbi:MAG: hypothetical protein N2643_00540 [Endomicrobia bacterium]|nr:hypothetical protein [Endomicrobiia bacterium]
MKKYIQEDSKIKILKYKLSIKKLHIYTCCVIVVNVKTKSILKISCIVSFSPSIYEIDINEDYVKVENMINKYKLESKSCFDLTKKIYLRLYEKEEIVGENINKEKLQDIENIFLEVLDVKEKEIIRSNFCFQSFSYYGENLSANPFSFNKEINLDINRFFIKMRPVLDEKKGVSISKVKVKQEIMCELIDRREIVKYIMQTLFSKDIKFVYGKVTEINKKDKNFCEILCNITPIIYTKFLININKKAIIKR